MTEDLRRHRLQEVVKKLAARGISQATIAATVKVTPQYLSDVLKERRPLSELLARRIGENFGYDFAWILGQQSVAVKGVGQSAGDSGVWLPVLPHPVEGDPRVHPIWDGGCFQVPTIAFSICARARDPYVLRYRQIDVERRLHKNDLVLISQTPEETAPIVVALSGKKCFLARREAQRWVRLANGRVLGNDTTLVGHCLGVLWSTLL